jgi:hypothetical protein
MAIGHWSNAPCLVRNLLIYLHKPRSTVYDYWLMCPCLFENVLTAFTRSGGKNLKKYAVFHTKIIVPAARCTESAERMDRRVETGVSKPGGIIDGAARANRRVKEETSHPPPLPNYPS